MNKDFFKQVRILDGGMGQELHAKGLISMGTLWSASANLEKKFHNLVVDLHLSYINSGADVIVTNTFSARRIRLIQNKVNEHFKYINEQACLLAIKAKDLSKKNILIAGSLPSQSDTYVEDQRKSNEIEKDFLDQATIINPYVDFFYLDVLSSGKELDIASNVAAKLKKPILAGVHLKKNCLLPSGESITEVVKKYKNENWLGLIGACVSPEIVENSIEELREINLPFGFKANLWEIEEPGPQRTFNTAKYDEIGTNPNIAFGKRDKYDPKLFYEFSEKIKEKGATILGGCCETTPSHIEAIAKLK
jgi:homocysteine S-methyltransferase|tara:strand:+ start:223 stop:1140 length:918 start_codon:yes stop_codon:yes gene_type:complete